MDQIVATLNEITAGLGRIGAHYAVGGSIASVAHGEIRSIANIDLVTDVSQDGAVALRDCLGAEWYADPFTKGECWELTDRTNVVQVHLFPACDEFTRPDCAGD